MNEKLSFFLRLGLAFAILAVVITRVDVKQILRVLGSLDLEYFWIALVLVPINLLLQILRWSLLLKQVEPKTTLFESINSFLGGLGVSLTMPGHLGEFARVLYVNSDNRLRLTGMVMIDKTLGFTITILAALLGFSLMLGNGYRLLFSAIGLGILYLSYKPDKTERFLRWVTGRLPFKDQTHSIISSLGVLNRKLVTLCLILGYLLYLIMWSQFFLLLSAFEKVSFQAVLFCLPLIILSISLPLTIGGLGIREAVAVLLLSRFNIAQATALNAVLLLFVINVLAPGLLGLALIPKIKVGRDAGRKRESPPDGTK